MRYAIVLGLLLTSGVAHAGFQEVGFFTAGERECQIENRHRACVVDEGLAEGDVVKLPLTSRAKELPIRWISQSARLDPVAPGKYKVVYQVPGKKNALVSLALDLLGFTRERSKRWRAIAATRGAPYQPRCEQPAELATLLPGQPLKLAWCGRNPQRIVVMDPVMNVLFAQPVRGLSSVVLTPDQLPLVSGITYSWDVIGSPSPGQRELKMLDRESAATVQEAFRELEASKDLDEREKIIGKASFALFMTESYPDEIGLRWLSYQLLEGLDPDALSKEETAMVRYLKRQTGIRPCGN